MKNDTVAMLLKGIGIVGGSMCIQYTSALGQWANEGVWPSGVNWHIIIVSTLGVGFTSLVGFCSGSYTKWQGIRNGGTQ